MAFPTNPSTNQVYTVNGMTYKYIGGAWVVKGAIAGPIGIQGIQGPIGATFTMVGTTLNITT